jgi:hypothetical protein
MPRAFLDEGGETPARLSRCHRATRSGAGVTPERQRGREPGLDACVEAGGNPALLAARSLYA